MEKYLKIDTAFYDAKYGLPRKGNAEEMWNRIKNDKDLLRWAIKPTKDKFGERDIVNGLAICDSMLFEYEDIDESIYKELVDLIYSNEKIARIVLDGYGNGGYSYLLMTLANPKLVLTEEQKVFAYKEAMNKNGTVKSEKEREALEKKLESLGITNNIVTTVIFGNQVNPIGAKAKTMFLASMFKSMSDTQAHGEGDFDIRYWILRNPNWTKEEKQKLIYDFWYNDEEYDEVYEQWEWAIINDPANFKGNYISELDYEYLYEYTFEDLKEFYGNEEDARRIMEEIEFCDLMHRLRPRSFETAKKPIMLED